MKKGKVMKIGAGVAAILISGIIVCNSIVETSLQAYAKESLPGVETIIANNGSNNAYTILEVVPKKDEAALGYLIGGEEPLKDGKSYLDIPVQEERREAFANTLSSNTVSGPSVPPATTMSGTSVTGIYAPLYGSGEEKALEITPYIEPGDASRSFSLKGAFKPDANGEYVELFQDADYKLLSTLPDGGASYTGTKYKRYTEFATPVADGKVITLAPVTNVTSGDRTMTIPGETEQQATAYKYLLNHKWSGADLVTVGNPDLSTLVGKSVFTESAGTYTYLGSVELLSTKKSRFRGTLPTLSGNSLSENEVPKELPKEVEDKDETLSGNEAPKEEETTTPESSEHTEPKTEESSSVVDKTVSKNAYSLYGMREKASSEALPEPSSEPKPEEPSSEPESEEPSSEAPTTPSDGLLPKQLPVLPPQMLAAMPKEVYAIHTSNGKYFVFESGEVGDITIGSSTITTELITGASGGVTIADLYITEMEINDAAGDYYVNTVTGITNTPHITPFLGWKQTHWYNPDENGEYYLASDAKTRYERYDALIHKDPDLQRVKWVTDYAYPEYEKVLHQGGIVNHEWFKRFVFDRSSAEEYENLVVDVKTVTMEEFNAYDLATVDLVYFAGSATVYPTDINPAQAQDVFLKVMNEKMPIMMTRSVADNNKANTNLYQLAALLRQKNLDDIDVKTEENGQNALAKNWGNSTFWTRVYTGVKAADTTYGLNYVNRSVFVFDDVIADGSGNKKLFVNLDFAKPLNDKQIAYGFAEVQEEIKNENLYRSLAGKDKLESTISQATAIRYIINFASQRNVIKSKINVLEIQPCSTRNYTEDQLKSVGKNGTRVTKLTRETIDAQYIANNWATQFKDKLDAISLDSTYTAEFIGQIKDLNENYDLIFIGMDTTTINTEINKGKKTDRTLYNRAEMNGLVYAHTGDEIFNSGNPDRKIGLLNPNDIDAEASMPEYHRYRLSGNDITPDKLRELKDFIDAGYPIIFGTDFFELVDGKYVVNTYQVDIKSNLCQLGEYVIKEGYMNKRAFAEDEVNKSAEAGLKKELKNCLNLSKLTVDMTKKPTPYQEGVKDSYLKGTNGNYQLEYELYLKNDAAISLLDTKYDCKLYIDTNVDGRYDKTEEIEGVQIQELQNGSWTPVYQTAERFSLTAGRYYRLQRQVPTGYAGILPWKLVFEQTGNSLVRKSSNGYSAVPVLAADRQVIKVLQLTSGNSTQTNLDLTSQSIKDLLVQVQDFDIQIEKKPVGQYIQTKGSVSNPNDFTEYSSVLNQYDMLVLGFIDMYQFGNGTSAQKKAAALAIRQYISDGRSVLFTHDTTSYRNTDTEWGYFFNRYIRDMVGMDRYGVMGQIAQKEGFVQVDSVFDTMWMPQITNETTVPEVLRNRQGYSNGNVLATYTNPGPFYSSTYMANSRPLNSSDTLGQYGGAMYVTELNQGQITEYPFKISEQFQVAATHNQYYQLNLDTDSRDSKIKDDIVVWYCISDVDGAGRDDCYQATPNDARNNYYIYNKGNVTYSGVGHSKVTQEMEMKLFVNTMVAAYNAGVHPPRVTYHETSQKGAAQIEYLYLPFDEAIGAAGEFIEKERDIIFSVADTSFVQGTKEIAADYFMEVSAGTAGATKTKVDNADVWLLKLRDDQIISCLEVDTNTPLTGAAMHKVKNRNTYQLVVPTSLFELETNNARNFYVGAQTTYQQNGVTTVTEVGYSKLELVRTQLFELE